MNLKNMTFYRPMCTTTKHLAQCTCAADPQPPQKVCPAPWWADAGMNRPAGRHEQKRSLCWSSRGARGSSPEPGLSLCLEPSAPTLTPLAFRPWRPWQRSRSNWVSPRLMCCDSYWQSLHSSLFYLFVYEFILADHACFPQRRATLHIT